MFNGVKIGLCSNWYIFIHCQDTLFTRVADQDGCYTDPDPIPEKNKQDPDPLPNFDQKNHLFFRHKCRYD